MAQYILGKNAKNYQIAKFEDSRYPISVYSIYHNRCSCPARTASCKHVKLFKEWDKLGKPIGAVFDDSFSLIGNIIEKNI